MNRCQKFTADSERQRAATNHSDALALSTPNGAIPMATAADPQRQHLVDGRRLAGQVRSAAWVLAFGAMLVWRCNFMRTAGAASFASLTLSNSFNSASQTGFSGAIRSAVAGFAAGVLHTLAGADHLAALTPLTIGRSPAKAGLLGSLWGFGHSTGQLILGLGLVLLKERFDAFAPALTKFGGFTVGGSLVFIGVSGLLEVWQDHRAAFKKSSADGQVALEGGPTVEVHTESEMDFDKLAASNNGLGVSLFANGVLFGLQPDAIFAIVPALTLPSRLAAAAYIGMFVFGTVAAMGSYTAIIGATSQAIQKNNPWLTTNLSVLASCIATVIGALILFGIF